MFGNCSGLEAFSKINQNLMNDIFVQVGGREDSNVYISNKTKRAADVGIEARHIKLPKSTTQADLEREIEALNADYNVDGIIVQVFIFA